MYNSKTPSVKRSRFHDEQLLTNSTPASSTSTELPMRTSHPEKQTLTHSTSASSSSTKLPTKKSHPNKQSPARRIPTSSSLTELHTRKSRPDQKSLTNATPAGASSTNSPTTISHPVELSLTGPASARSGQTLVQSNGTTNPDAHRGKISQQNSNDFTSYTPVSADQYTIAIVCATAKEFDPVHALFDGEVSCTYRHSSQDTNIYVVGRFANHHTVLMMPGDKGDLDAGMCTQRLRDHFRNIELTLLVGICGAMPENNALKEPIYLGDVIIGTKTCRYLHNSRTHQLHNDSVALQVRDLTVKSGSQRVKQLGKLLTTESFRERTIDASLANLKHLQGRRNGRKYQYPVSDSNEYVPDKFFEPSNLHLHRSSTFGCSCIVPVGSCCEIAMNTSCEDLDCESYGLKRSRGELHEPPEPNIHVGTIASADGVLRARAVFATEFVKADILGIDMEGGGVHEATDCIVVKSAVDYADTHKNKDFGFYAAATAASVAKALLTILYSGASISAPIIPVPHATAWCVPLTRNRAFAGRESHLARLEAHVASQDGQRLAVHGLGGCGKSALAIELAFRTRQSQPQCAVFWVSAVSHESFELSYRAIREHVGQIRAIEMNGDDKEIVKKVLSQENFGQWLLIVDNADDVDILFGTHGEGLSMDKKDRLIDFLPHSSKGSIIFTTRTRKAALQLADDDNILFIDGLEPSEATDLLKKQLRSGYETELEDEKLVKDFLELLAYFALAIVQALAFIKLNSCSISTYMHLYRESRENTAKLLGQEVDVDRNSRKSVATTWYISFGQMRVQNRLAADFLSFMACTANIDIPESMLPLPSGCNTLSRAKAIGTLLSYAFISERKRQTEGTCRTFDVHPLVHLAMQGWLRTQDSWHMEVKRTVEHLQNIIPVAGNYDTYKTMTVWKAYLPHALHVASLLEAEVSKELDKMNLLRQVASCEEFLGRDESAGRIYQQLMEFEKQTRGEKHRAAIEVKHHLSWTMIRQHKYEEGKKLAEETLALCRDTVGREDLLTLHCMVAVAIALAELDQKEESERMLREALHLSTELHGEKSIHTLHCAGYLSRTLYHLGKFEEAEISQRRILAVYKENGVLGHPNTFDQMSIFCQILHKQRKHTEEEEVRQELVKLSMEILGAEHDHTLVYIHNYALFLERRNRLEEAAVRHKQVYDTMLGMNEANNYGPQVSLERYNSCQRKIKERGEQKG